MRAGKEQHGDDVIDTTSDREAEPPPDVLRMYLARGFSWQYETRKGDAIVSTPDGTLAMRRDARGRKMFLTKRSS